MKKISQGYNNGVFQILMECPICKNQMTFDSSSPLQTEEILNKVCPVCKDLKGVTISYGVFELMEGILEIIEDCKTKEEAIDFIHKYADGFRSFTILEIYS